MSVLTKSEIIEYIKKGKLKFEPNLDGFQLQPHAIDLRIGYSFYVPKTWRVTKNGREALKIDPLDQNCLKQNFEKIILKDGQYFELLPKEFIIGTTLEKIDMHSGDIMGVLYPRSSANRRGLSVDLSGIIDVWYKGNLMLPISNNTQTQTIKIYPGERICQITLHTLSSNINKQQGLIHGLSKTKYSHKQKEFIFGKKDKNCETSLIKSGKIKILKRNYKVEI